jgi:hypothetical protein
MAELPVPTEGIILTHFIVSDDVDRSRAFYADVLGGEVAREREPAMVQLANSWIIINAGGGPTVDKPDVVLETPPDPTRTSSFLNIRVADVWAIYEDWRSRSSPRRKTSGARSGATCVTLTGTSSRSGRRPASADRSGAVAAGAGAHSSRCVALTCTACEDSPPCESVSSSSSAGTGFPVARRSPRSSRSGP